MFSFTAALRFWICIILLLSSKQSFAQDKQVKHFGVEDGLSSNIVYAAMQDKRGFIWFATDNGVSRYDGIEFKNFNSKAGLPDNDIVDFAEDKLGRIWLSCFNGTPCYIERNNISSPQNNESLKSIAKEGYMYFCNTGSRIFVTRQSGTNNGFEIDENGRLHFPVISKNFLPIGQQFIDKDALQNGGLYLYDEKTLLVDSFISPLKKSLKSLLQCYISYDSNRFAMLYKNNVLFRFEIKANQIRFRDTLHLHTSFSLIYYYMGSLWGQTIENGIIPLDNNFQKDSTKESLFVGKQSGYFFVDREYNYWLCTQGGGVYIIRNDKIKTYSQDNGLYKNDIQKIVAFGNELFIGYNNFRVQRLSDGMVSNIDNHFQSAMLGKMHCLYTDSTYLVYSSPTELFLLNKQNNEKHILSKVGSAKYIVPSKIKNSVWLGTHSRCFRLQFPNKIVDTIECKRAVSILERKNGQLIVGTLYGLLVCTKINNKWHIDTMQKPSLLKGLTVSCLAEVDGVLVVGTIQKGLLLIKGNEFEFVKNRVELQDVNCKSIKVDDQKNIWLTSFSGLHKIVLGKDIHNFTIENIGKHISANNLFVNDIAFVKDKIYVASSAGLIEFAADNIGLKDTKRPVVYVNEILVNGNSIGGLLNQELKLKASTNIIEFKFSGIDFKSLGNISFRYRLIGLKDNNWEIITKNYVRFDALPSGDYRLEVFAKNIQGLESAMPAIITFSIEPHWWQNKLFWLGIILLFLFLGYLCIRWWFLRKHSIEIKQTQIKKHIAEIELKAIKAQINPHFIFNTLNSIQYFISNNQTSEAEIYLSKLGRLLRNTLYFSSRTVVKLTDEILFLDNYLQLEKLRFDEYFSYEIQTKIDDKALEHIEIPPMVLQPHIENSLKHSFQGRQKQKKEIIVRFELLENKLICTIQDNGIGRKASMEKKKHMQQRHSSKGIELSKSKLEMYAHATGQNVMTEIVDLYNNATPIGTSITITINVNKNDYYIVDR